MINKYKIEEGGSAKIVIDTVQIQLQCCGYDDMLDWRPEEVAIIGRGVSRDNVTIRDQDWLPRSCCGAAPCTQDKAFREPCKLKLRENALNPNTAIGIIGKMEFISDEAVPMENVYFQEYLSSSWSLSSSAHFLSPSSCVALLEG